MADFSNERNFATDGAQAVYKLVVNVKTTAVSGGTRVDVKAYGQQIRFATNITPAFSNNGSKSIKINGGRSSITATSLSESDSGTWAYDFGANSIQYIWGSATTANFTRFIPFAYGTSTTVSVTAAGSGSSFLRSTTVSVAVTLESQPNATVPNVVGQDYITAYNTIANAGLSPNIAGSQNTTNSSQNLLVYSQSPAAGSSVSPGSQVDYYYYTYVAPQYTVTFNPANGGSSSSVTVTENNTTTTPGTPSRTGFTFNGWLSGYDGLVYAASSTTHAIVSNTTFTAQWTAIQYTISFEENGGTEVANITANSGTNQTLPTTTRSGYSFNGWFSNSALTVGPFTSWTLNANQILYAKWTLLAPGFTDESISPTLLLNQNIANVADRSVSATNATNYEIIYAGSGLSPVSWLTINSSGQLSGSTNITGTYTFIINAINAENVKTPSSIKTITVVYPGKRINAALGTNNITRANRLSNSGWVPITLMRRFDGEEWKDITN